MPAETVASSIITNITAAPPKLNDARTGGRNFMRRGLCTATTGKTTGGFYGFFRIPANAVIVSCELTCAALGTSTAGDLGLYEVSNPFAPVTQAGSISNAKQYFGAGIDLSGALTKSQKLIQSSWTTVAKMDQMVWQILGLSADPAQGTPIGSVEYDVVLTSTATINTGGAMVVEISYKMP
jgi:hypothetical protein